MGTEVTELENVLACCRALDCALSALSPESARALFTPIRDGGVPDELRPGISAHLLAKLLNQLRALHAEPALEEQ